MTFKFDRSAKVADNKKIERTNLNPFNADKWPVISYGIDGNNVVLGPENKHGANVELAKVPAEKLARVIAENGHGIAMRSIVCLSWGKWTDAKKEIYRAMSAKEVKALVEAGYKVSYINNAYANKYQQPALLFHDNVTPKKPAAKKPAARTLKGL